MQCDQSVQQILEFFPASYTTFEVVTILRIFYFLCSNIISSTSFVFAVDEAEIRVKKAERMIKNQKELNSMTEQIM